MLLPTEQDVDAQTDRLYWMLLDGEDAFKAGRKAGLNSCPNTNPHRRHTWEHREWHHGWMQGTNELVQVDA